MKEIIESVVKHTHIAVIVLGLLVILIASLEKMPWYGENIPIHTRCRVILLIVGISLVLVGIAGSWLKMCQESASIGLDQGTSATDALKHQPPDGEPMQKIRCKGTLVDSYIGDSEKIVEMPESRRWTYQLRDIEIKIYQDVLSLEFEALIKSQHSDVTEVYKNYSSGPFIDGVGFLTYSFGEVDGGSATWKGLMVLRVPRRGKINGYWMTTNVNRDDKFPIGTITLTRRS